MTAEELAERYADDPLALADRLIAAEQALREIAAGEYETVPTSDVREESIDGQPASVQYVRRVRVDAVGIARAAPTRSGQQK